MMIYYLITLLLGAGFCAYKMAVIDWRRQIIPDVYLWPFMLLGLVLVVFFPWVSSPSESVIAAAFGYGLGALVGYIFEKIKRGKSEHSPIGLGDVKLMAAGGIWLGMTGLAIAIMISCVIGWIWGIINDKKYIPFAPFFLIGLIIALFTMYFLI